MTFLFIGLLSILMTPLGAFLLWRRWSFLGDSLAHCALLGAAFGVAIGVPWMITYCFIAILVAISLLLNPHKGEQWLSMISYGAVPLGLLCFSFLPKVYINPKDVLFGDPDHVDILDWGMLLLLGVLIVGVMRYYWSTWLFMTFDRDLALVEGLPVRRLEYVFVLLITMSLALCMKSVGQLLAPGLMVMPAMAAGYIATTPEQLIKHAIYIVIGAVFIVTFLSWILAVPFTPLLLSLLFFTIIGTRVFLSCKKRWTL